MLWVLERRQILACVGRGDTGMTVVGYQGPKEALLALFLNEWVYICGAKVYFERVA